ncbi:MAG: hypothetical protein ACI83O_000195 [Patescibacteria group bacterium]|jgi:hypothetical protein
MEEYYILAGNISLNKTNDLPGLTLGSGSSLLESYRNVVARFSRSQKVAESIARVDIPMSFLLKSYRAYSLGSQMASAMDYFSNSYSMRGPPAVKLFDENFDFDTFNLDEGFIRYIDEF